MGSKPAWAPQQDLVKETIEKQSARIRASVPGAGPFCDDECCYQGATSRKERQEYGEDRGFKEISRKSVWQPGLPSGSDSKSWLRRTKWLVKTEHWNERNQSWGTGFSARYYGSGQNCPPPACVLNVSSSAGGPILETGKWSLADRDRPGGMGPWFLPHSASCCLAMWTVKHPPP